MNIPEAQTLMERLNTLEEGFTPKNRALAAYVVGRPREAVFMTARELAANCGVSDATVIRFVHHLGYGGYPEFIQALRDLLDSEFTMMDRVDLISRHGLGADQYHRVISQEIENLRSLYDGLDPERLDRVAEELIKAPRVDIVGARLSYTYAYYLGWSLGKLRKRVRTHDGCDSWSIDLVTQLPDEALLVFIATSRYPNVLLRLARLARRLRRRIVLIADSNNCPLIQFADQVLIAPFKRFPLYNSPSTLAAMINCLVVGMISKMGHDLREHQSMLEQMYRENDIFFNLDKD